MNAGEDALHIRPLGLGIKEQGDIVVRHGILGQVGEGIGAGAEGHQGICIQFKEHDAQILNAAGHGGLLVQQGQVADVLIAQTDIQPHHIVGPQGLFLLPEGEALHMGVPGHTLDNALGPAEEVGDIFAVTGEGAGDVLALGGELFPAVIGGGIIRVPEHLGALKDGELREETLIFHHGLAQIGQQGGADETLVGRGGCGQGEDAGGILQNGAYILVGHPGIGEDLLHPAADGQILLDTPL